MATHTVRIAPDAGPRSRSTLTNLRLSTTRAGGDGYNGRMPTRSVRLTSPERVLFPDDGITKADVFEYYRAIAPVLVPHLRNRPFTLKRYPYGATGDVYFQKQAPKGMPSWIPTRTFRTYPREGGSRGGGEARGKKTEGGVRLVEMK